MNFEIKENLLECLVNRVSYYYWVLPWVHYTSSGGSTPLILEYPILQVAWQHLISISFLHLFTLFLPLLHHFSSILYVIVLFFSFSVFIVFSFHYMLFISAHHDLNHHIIVFSLCPLLENLHTYLTTWLSSCPMVIFFRFVTIFCLKLKFINKVQLTKCEILKSTYINTCMMLVLIRPFVITLRQHDLEK